MRAVFTRVFSARPPSRPEVRHRQPPRPAVRADAIGAHQLREDALAQAPVGDADALGGKAGADRLEDRAAREHQVGALDADAAVGGAIGIAHRAQPPDRGVDFAARQPEPVDRAPVVAGEIEMHAGDRRHGARRAEQMEARAPAQMRDPRGEGGERLVDVADHRREHFRRDVLAAKSLGERDDAEPQRFPGLDLPRPAVVAAARHPDDLGGAAADVEQHGAFGLRVGEFAAAGGREIGLGATVDDLEFEADAFAHPVQELAPVRRRSGRPRSRSVARA